jgi:hypothetical protein
LKIQHSSPPQREHNQPAQPAWSGLSHTTVRI